MRRLAQTKRSLWQALIFALLAQASNQAMCDETIAEPTDRAGRDPIGIEAGYVYTQGKYSSTVESKSTVKNLTLSWTAFDMDFQFTTLYLERTAPAGTIIARVKKVVTVTPRIVSSSGAGDLSLSVNKEIFTDPATAIAVNAVGEMKIATADSAKGLGTGKNDYTVGLTASYPFETAVVSGGAKYSVLGDPGKIKVNGIVEDIRFNNIWSGYFAFTTELTSRSNATFSFNMAQPSGTATNYYQVLELATSYRFSEAASLRIFTSKGTNQNSPDWSAGLVLSGNF
ncbi:hypothetical protein ACO0K3_09865 [Undibacterium sp. Rencai35W]|uniref:hypothetical protein n=1 Tax=Undibacterium sp. Rencai35W TaxID=3413046 RepID=UPI003BEFA3B9